MSLKKRAGILKKNGEITFDRILKISEFVSKAAHKSFSMYFVWAEKSRQNFTINLNQANFALVGLAKKNGRKKCTGKIIFVSIKIPVFLGGGRVAAESARKSHRFFQRSPSGGE